MARDRCRRTAAALTELESCGSATYAEQELVVIRDGKPIAAMVCMDGLRALRHVAQEFVEQLGEERLRVMLGN